MMKKIISYLLIIGILLTCSADVVYAQNAGDANAMTVMDSFQYEETDDWDRTYTISVNTCVGKTGKGNTHYKYDVHNSLTNSTQSVNIYSVNIKDYFFYRHTAFGGNKYTLVFDLDIEDKQIDNYFCNFTLSDGTKRYMQLNKIDQDLVDEQTRDNLKEMYSKNIGKYYCLVFYDKNKPNKVDSLVMHSVWYGTLKMETYAMDNKFLMYDDTFMRWLGTLDYDNPKYRIATPADDNTLLTPNGGKVTRRKAEIKWHVIEGNDIYYDVYVCTGKNYEKCKCDRSKTCKHFKKLTTTKNTSCVMTKWPNGKKLDLTKDKVIWIKIRAKKKIDGKWIVSNCLNTFVDEDDIK